MKRNSWAMVVALGLTAAPVFGQGTVVVQSAKQTADTKQASDVADKIKLELAQKMKLSVVSRVVQGAPYSADATTESVQTLADGNRIVNRTTTKVYRDSEGRTRTDRVEPGGTQVVSITDATTGTTYMLYPQSRNAVQSGAVFVTQGDVGFATTTIMDKVTAEKKASAEARTASTFTYVTRTDGAAVGEFAYAGAVTRKNVTREDLGEQLMEGVMATGTRTTTVIPAGAIGNEQPIQIVSEEWMCRDLGILVMTKHSDPRSGETTYRVTNINRAEPDPSLFQLPADYKVQQSTIKRQSR